jgi:chromosome segregation ATPase
MPDNLPSVTLRDYIERVIGETEEKNKERIRALERQVADLERLLESRMRAQAMAVDKAAAGYDARFASANEFRQAMQDLSATFATRENIDQRLTENGRRLNAIESRLSNLDGRIVGWSAGVGFLVLVITLIIQFAGG